jgi:LmbE family N-acetylglucosaminyl deacetylase
MATLVCFHAHPDDECIATGGVMAKASKEGHRVVLVVATKGENGEVPDGFLDPGEELWQRRVKETEAAADVLGVHRVEFLGYVDSGMIGTPENDVPGSFWMADIDEAAERLATILREENTDVFTIYDDHGGYGHPDHIQVHRVGKRAAELAGVDKVYQSTINRDHIIKGMMERASEMPEDFEMPDFEGADDFGSSETVITGAVDVTEFIDHKRRAMRAHASQISEQSFFLQMPDDAFSYGFGTEWFIRDGQGPGITETEIL